MAIDDRHSDFEKYIDTWRKIDNVCDDEEVDQYLLKINSPYGDEDTKERNNAYKMRAVWYGLTGYTVAGMVGLVFNKMPVLSIPASLDYMKQNASGEGVSIYQLARKALNNVIRKSRAGLYVTFPKTNPEQPISKADMEAGKVFASVQYVDAKSIIYWARTNIGALSVLSQVVIAERDYSEEAGEVVDQWRELALNDEGVFVWRVWRKFDDKLFVYDSGTPTKGNGELWREIPFVFIGGSDNTSNVDAPELKKLCNLDIAIYRNSADWEDSLWYAGQAQPWMSGITQNHIDLMKANKMYVGSRNVLGVPSGEQFSFSVPPANQPLNQAIKDKVEMAIGLGARFIQPGSAAKTATQSGGEQQQQHSKLSLMASNVSDAFTKAIEYACVYMNEQYKPDYFFALNTDFLPKVSSAQDLSAVVASFVQGALPLSDYFAWMKKYEYVDGEKTLDEFGQEVSASNMPDLGGADNAASVA